MKSKLVWFIAALATVASACVHVSSPRSDARPTDTDPIIFAGLDFQNALQSWREARHNGASAFLYYYGLDGPLTDEFFHFQKSGEGRSPEAWKVECIRCSDESNCQVIAEVEFHGEGEPQWREFDLVRDGVYKPFFDRKFDNTLSQRAKIAACKDSNEAVLLQWSNKQEAKMPSVDSDALRSVVMNQFDAEMSRYRDRNWDDLSKPYLEFPLRPLLARIQYHNTKERLISSGELPTKWQISCAYLSSPGSYTLVGNLAHERIPSEMISYRFISTTANGHPINGSWSITTIEILPSYLYTEVLSRCEALRSEK